MKRKLFGLILVLALTMISAFPVSATEQEVESVENEAQVDEAVQVSYDAYCAMKAAMENRDLNALRTATAKFEAANENLTDEQQDELIALAGEDFYVVLIEANAIETTANLHDEFLADKNTGTAMSFVENYKLHFEEECFGAEFNKMLEEMIPTIHDTYAEALTYMPSENVLAVYNAYVPVEDALSFLIYDEDFVKAIEGFEAVLDTYNELSEDEWNELAFLLGEEDVESAYGRILTNWVNANIVNQMGQLYNAYLEDPNEETAAAFVEYYDSIYHDPAYEDEELRQLVSGFFMDISNVYEEAKTLVSDLAEPEEEAKEENVEVVKEAKEASPKTGDNISVVWPLIGMFIAIAALAVTRKRRA